MWVTGALTLALALFWTRQWQIAGTAGLSSFPLDDAWIHLHFARNLAEGHGFGYNPDVPVAGSTAPLWTLVLAGGAATGSTTTRWPALTRWSCTRRRGRADAIGRNRVRPGPGYNR